MECQISDRSEFMESSPATTGGSRLALSFCASAFDTEDAVVAVTCEEQDDSNGQSNIHSSLVEELIAVGKGASSPVF